MEENISDHTSNGLKDKLRRAIYWVMRRIFANFLKGILLIFPTAATIFIIYKSFNVFDDFLGKVVFKIFGYEFPGTGILISFTIITLIGYIVSKIATTTIIDFIEKFLSKIPIVRTIYSSMKDFSEAIIGEKKKFSEPVLVKMGDSGIIKLGFVTQKDLSQLKLQNHSAVYFPYSYSFMGSLSIVPNDRLIPAEVNSTELMKFILSAGVTTLEEKDDHKHEKQSVRNNNDH
jgi:uncharacterized membrane protein